MRGVLRPLDETIVHLIELYSKTWVLSKRYRFGNGKFSKTSSEVAVLAKGVSRNQYYGDWVVCMQTDFDVLQAGLRLEGRLASH